LEIWITLPYPTITHSTPSRQLNKKAKTSIPPSASSSAISLLQNADSDDYNTEEIDEMTQSQSTENALKYHEQLIQSLGRSTTAATNSGTATSKGIATKGNREKDPKDHHPLHQSNRIHGKFSLSDLS